MNKQERHAVARTLKMTGLVELDEVNRIIDQCDRYEAALREARLQLGFLQDTDGVKSSTNVVLKRIDETLKNYNTEQKVKDE